MTAHRPTRLLTLTPGAGAEAVGEGAWLAVVGAADGPPLVDGAVGNTGLVDPAEADGVAGAPVRAELAWAQPDTSSAAAESEISRTAGLRSMIAQYGRSRRQRQGRSAARTS
jgi:hypothetical protein